MNNILKSIVVVVSTLLFVIVTAFSGTFLLPSDVSAASKAQSYECEPTVLGIPPWYRGLVDDTTDECLMKSPADAGGLNIYVWKIVMNVVGIGLMLANYIAAGFIIYGGFTFLTGGDKPDQVQKGRKIITNASIGLVIAISAVVINNVLFSII